MSSPTLLVGLGGTGSKIVAKVSDMISDEQRRDISCVIFDTDANDIPMIKTNNPEIRVVQTSARMTVGEYLEEDHYARDTWFPNNPILDRKVLSEGAGQVRSISRLGFESAIRIGHMDPLHDAITDLYKVDQKKAENSLRVTIVSSLAGGTGSGLIVPVAMYIQRYLEDHFHQNSNITRGFFILPEVFYGAIPADQRDNLKSNAYASLRELDAFLVKGNKLLSEEYQDSVKLEMPVAGTDRHEDYDVLPYNFCFLFDAQNAEGKKLNSLEQYMDHAANIIYSMSIGPMNKRSNSAEDNVIRKLAKEGGRNRYAGAGASRLIYPYEDICQYIGLNWAKQSVSEQWLEYDRQFKMERERAAKRREEGYFEKEVNRSEKYTSSIESDANGKKPFAQSILLSVKNPQEGKDSVAAYLNNVDDYLISGLTGAAEVQNTKATLDSYLKKIDEDTDINEEKTYLNKAASELQSYLQSINAYVENEYRNVAYTLYEGASNQGKLDQGYYLEKVIENNGQILHPNAVRYLLIKILDDMKKIQKGDQQFIDANEKNLLNFVEQPWKKFLEEEGAKSFDEYKPKGIFGTKKKHKEKHNELKRTLKSKEKAIEDLGNRKIRAKVYERGIQYMNSLIEGLEQFYDAFESQIDLLDERQEAIEKRYTQAPGMTVRYVLASHDALEALSKRYPYTGSLLNVDSDLSKRIVDKTFAYAKMNTKPNPSRYFGDLFEEQILEHYQELANKKVNKDLDNGILAAIELEADLLLSEEQKESSMAVDQYVRDVIGSTRALSTPFIEKPSEINASPIYASAFHPSLLPARGDESYQAKLIQEELIAKGGIGDDEIDKNTIMFYQSYYGLRANSLSKFAPPRHSETYQRNGGEYFNAYSELVSGIHPNSRKSQEISPHIDRRWHLAAKMPDLDEGNQVIEEYGISAAFFWALVFDYLKFNTESSGQDVFDLENILLGISDGTLLVDDQKRASKLHEVLQALSMQPSYVSTIRKKVQEQIDFATDSSIPVEKTEIYRKMKNIQTWYKPEWIGLETEETVHPAAQKLDVSLFEIPLIMKAAMPASETNDERLLKLLQVMLKESASYLAGFSSPEELAGKIRTFISDQYDKFTESLKNIEEKNTDAGNKFVHDSLVADELDTAAIFLQENGVYDLAAEMIKNAKDRKA
ncbi:tubulin-like doman-containing protein [Ileibacterium valens]|nr:tubulin-like doman-containing protein [Ileibacterium valens]